MQNYFESKHTGKVIDNSIDKIVNDEFASKSDYLITKSKVVGMETSKMDADDTYTKLQIDEKLIEKASLSALTNKVDKEIGKNLIADVVLARLFNDVVYNPTDGKMTFTRQNDTVVIIDLPLELIVTSGTYNHATKQIVLTLANGGTIDIPVEDLLTDIYNKSELDALLSNKVSTEPGKGLSEQNFTAAEKTKLSGIAAGAQVNTIESIKVDGSTLPTTSKAVNVDLSGKLDVNDYVDPETIVDFGVDGTIWLENGKTVYKMKFTDEGFRDISLEIRTDNLVLTDLNYRFELIWDCDNSAQGIPPSFFIMIGEHGIFDSPTWLVPPTIEHPHTLNKFVFETFDGGVTWYANQCYSVEVT